MLNSLDEHDLLQASVASIKCKKKKKRKESKFIKSLLKIFHALKLKTGLSLNTLKSYTLHNDEFID